MRLWFSPWPYFLTQNSGIHKSALLPIFLTSTHFSDKRHSKGGKYFPEGLHAIFPIEGVTCSPFWPHVPCPLQDIWSYRVSFCRRITHHSVVCVGECTWGHMSVHIEARGWCWYLSSITFHLYFLRQGLFSYWTWTHWARVDAQWDSGIDQSSFHKLGGGGIKMHMISSLSEVWIQVLMFLR